jgi:hypothetical protein
LSVVSCQLSARNRLRLDRSRSPEPGHANRTNGRWACGPVLGPRRADRRPLSCGVRSRRSQPLAPLSREAGRPASRLAEGPRLRTGHASPLSAASRRSTDEPSNVVDPGALRFAGDKALHPRMRLASTRLGRLANRPCRGIEDRMAVPASTQPNGFLRRRMNPRNPSFPGLSGRGMPRPDRPLQAQGIVSDPMPAARRNVSKGLARCRFLPWIDTEGHVAVCPGGDGNSELPPGPHLAGAVDRGSRPEPAALAGGGAVFSARTRLRVEGDRDLLAGTVRCCGQQADVDRDPFRGRPRGERSERPRGARTDSSQKDPFP